MAHLVERSAFDRRLHPQAGQSRTVKREGGRLHRFTQVRARGPEELKREELLDDRQGSVAHDGIEPVHVPRFDDDQPCRRVETECLEIARPVQQWIHGGKLFKRGGLDQREIL